MEHVHGVSFAYDTTNLEYGSPHTTPVVRNAHLADLQAILCAHNVRLFLQSIREPSYLPHYLNYPKDAVGSPLVPLIAIVSLGHWNGILIFDDLVLGGWFWSPIARALKYVITYTKIAEIRHSFLAK